MKFRGKFFNNRTWFTPKWGEVVMLLVWLLVGALLGNLVSLPLISFLGQEGMEYAQLVAYPLMFIPPIIYARIKSSKNCLWSEPAIIDRNGFGRAGGLGCALAAAAGTLALAFVVDPLTELLPPMPDALKEAMKALVNGKLWVNILCVSVMAPLLEEWLCRGTILRGLLGNGVRPGWAIAASALIFALIHANPWQAVPAFILGLLFGYVYYRTGSLKLTVLMHFTNNSFSLIVSRIPRFEDMESWRDVLQGPQYWMIFSACILLTFLSILTFNKAEENAEK